MKSNLSSRKLAASLLNKRLSQVTYSVASNSPRIMSADKDTEFQGLAWPDLPKSNRFTTLLPPDPQLPTPEASEAARTESPGLLLPRNVRGGLYTYVKPDFHDLEKTEVLAVSTAAMRDLGLRTDEINSPIFKELVVGNRTCDKEGIYPWATLYGGWQFGQWAGQLGDGRAISICEATNPSTGVRYEVQIKGAGRTPFSRFADGRAVLRSSIREFLVSEALHALSIPTTRALSLSYFTNEKVLRERIEPRAVVVRMAESWLRIGSFDIHRMRGDRKMMKILADYCIDEVFGGEDKIRKDAEDNGCGEAYKGVGRYRLLYKEIIRRTANTTAQWQTYGFMNGVLNTDNISIYGLSMDYGPFSFMDTYDPSFTPNHDDHSLRYCYRNTPTVMWWNLVRLGESLAELFAIPDPSFLETEEFFESGVPKEQFDDFVSTAEKIIGEEGEFYMETFQHKYVVGFCARLGLQTSEIKDAEQIISSVLELLRDHHLDFNNFFRRLSNVTFFVTGDPTAQDVEKLFLSGDRGYGALKADKSREAILAWLLNVYKPRLEKEGNTNDALRKAGMDKVNPHFILRNWILEEVIKRAESENDRDIIDHVLLMALTPFEEKWTIQEENPKRFSDEQRFLGDVPSHSQGITCSCSS